MAFWKVNGSEEAVKDRAEGNWISKSGIYNVTLKHVLFQQSQNGSKSLNFVIDLDGQEQVMYNAIRLTNNDGTDNFEANLFNKLCVVCGAADGDDVHDPVPVTLKIGNKEAEQYQELQDFQNENVLMRVQMEYRRYNESIQEKRAIKNFFRITDKATAQEIINGVEPGKQYIEEEKIGDKITYKDGLTPEEVQTWIKNGRNKGNDQQDDTKSFGKQRHTFGRTA